MSAYYNENDPKAAATLRELIHERLIAPGEVDQRSIEDVRPNELMGYTQCHFFAGFGIWSYAFRLAGWPDDRPAWSGSCPCQPFSAAGKRTGLADERHLWPAFFHLIQHGKPRNVPVLGEQVASPDGLAWLDIVCADMEAENHAVWPFDICAAGFGAPIMRQRLFWLAVALGDESRPGLRHREPPRIGRDKPADSGGAGGLESADSLLTEQSARAWARPNQADGTGSHRESAGPSELSGMAIAGNRQLPLLERRQERRDGAGPAGALDSGAARPGPTNGFWGSPDWLYCRDGKWRPVKSGTFPLAHGYPERVGILRGAGNAINSQAAKAFIESVMEVIG